jgi:parvulin-like peptidyl-prolyl isomerase
VSLGEVRSNFLTFLALGAFFVATAALVAGCGGGGSSSIPSDSVAKVGDQSITRAQFNHWLAVAAKGNASAAPGTSPVVPDPPKFTKCVAAKKKAPQTKTKPKSTDAQLKSQCAQEYKTLRDQTMNFLIQADWVAGEAKARKVTISNAEVQKQFQQTKKQAFPKDADFKNFLKTSGMTMGDILFRVRLDALSNKLRQAIIKDKSKVSSAQIKAFYDKNKSRFGTPEKRDLLIVLTKTKAKADAAKKALQGGQSFKAVVKQYSVDQQTKKTGGLLKGVAKGQQDADLDKAAFSAPKGKLVGPVKAQFGYYVLEVRTITKATQQSLASSTATIRQQLLAQNQQKALDAFIKSFRSKWTADTHCRRGYVVTGCKGAPKTSTTSTSGGAAPPQQSTSPGG